MSGRARGARSGLSEQVSAWGLGAYDTDAMTITQDAPEATETHLARPRQVTKTDLSMRLGAVGARGALLEPGEAGGMDLALKVDASRLRLVLEGGRSFGVGWRRDAASGPGARRAP